MKYVWFRFKYVELCMGNTKMVQNENISFEYLSGRYGPGSAQEICDRLEKQQRGETRTGKNSQIELLDVMEVNEVAHRFWLQTKEYIAAYRATERLYRGNDKLCPEAKIYLHWELILKRRQIFDARLLCQMARQDSRTLTNDYERKDTMANEIKFSLPTVNVYRAAA